MLGYYDGKGIATVRLSDTVSNREDEVECSAFGMGHRYIIGTINFNQTLMPGIEFGIIGNLTRQGSFKVLELSDITYKYIEQVRQCIEGNINLHTLQLDLIFNISPNTQMISSPPNGHDISSSMYKLMQTIKNMPNLMHLNISQTLTQRADCILSAKTDAFLNMTTLTTLCIPIEQGDLRWFWEMIARYTHLIKISLQIQSGADHVRYRDWADIMVDVLMKNKSIRRVDITGSTTGGRCLDLMDVNLLLPLLEQPDVPRSLSFCDVFDTNTQDQKLRQDFSEFIYKWDAAQTRCDLTISHDGGLGGSMMYIHDLRCMTVAESTDLREITFNDECFNQQKDVTKLDACRYVNMFNNTNADAKLFHIAHRCKNLQTLRIVNCDLSL